MNGLRFDSAMTDTTNRSPNAIALAGLGDHFQRPISRTPASLRGGWSAGRNRHVISMLFGANQTSAKSAMKAAPAGQPNVSNRLWPAKPAIIRCAALKLSARNTVQAEITARNVMKTDSACVKGCNCEGAEKPNA